MTFEELLPQLQSLSRLEKLRMIQFLVEDLERDGVSQDDLFSCLGERWMAQNEANFLKNTKSFMKIVNDLFEKTHSLPHLQEITDDDIAAEIGAYRGSKD